MSQPSPSTERKVNLWAPWRMEYIDTLGAKDEGGCFLCRYRDEPQRDNANYVLWRGQRSLAVLNRFPYTGGHSMVAPLEHLPDLGGLDGATMLEMMEMVRDLQAALADALHAEGFNIGINVGRCAGAGLPGHLHIHVVPRWSGDTNFMPVFGDVRVIPQTLERLYGAIRDAATRQNLPRLTP